MSNIGFIEHCASNIQRIFNAAIEPEYTEDGKKKRCKSVSRADKDYYVFLIEQIELMKAHNEIEDLERFKKAYKIILECNLLNVKEIRKQLAKRA